MLAEFPTFALSRELLQRASVVVIVAFISMRLTPVRRALSGGGSLWKYQIFSMFFFGFLAMLGTHFGMILNTETGLWSLTTPMHWPLEPHEGVLGVRDLMVLLAGIFGGLWVGLGAGVLAGLDRYFFGGNVGEISAIATAMLGLGAGGGRYLWPEWSISVKGILTIIVLGTLAQKIMLYLSPIFLNVPTVNITALVSWQLTLPVFLENCFGCLLFYFVWKELETDKIKMERDQQKIRAQGALLRAQVGTHFLKHLLMETQALIEIDTRAFEFLSKMDQFFSKTRASAGASSVTLADELSHLKLYLELQSHRFPDKFNYSENIPESLLPYHIAPRSLQTLVENIFVHARHGTKAPIKIGITGEDLNDCFQIKVIDSGCGMPQERANMLGAQEVASNYGSGSALYHISCTLAFVFQGNASLKIESQKGVGTTIILHIPKRLETW